MCLLSTDYISDARNFQRCGEYELAIMSLNRAREVDKQKKNGVEIEKLLSFNYRKLKQFDLALFHINNAIKDAKLACNLAHDKQTKNDYAICLMNKGIIYETINATDKVEACYLPALEIFIDLVSNTSLFIRSIGEDLFQKSICFSSLITNINTNISVDTSSLNIFSIDGLIKGILSISLLNLVFTYSLRYVLIKVFVLITPFAFLSLILSNTSWFFKAWLKNLFSLLFIQIIVSIILLLMFSVDFSNTDLFSKFIYVGGMYGLIRANSLVRDFIGGISTTVAQSVKTFTNLK